MTLLGIKKGFLEGRTPATPALESAPVAGVDVTAGPLARGQSIYGRASQTEQRSTRWAS